MTCPYCYKSSQGKKKKEGKCRNKIHILHSWSRWNLKLTAFGQNGDSFGKNWEMRGSIMKPIMKCSKSSRMLYPCTLAEQV